MIRKLCRPLFAAALVASLFLPDAQSAFAATHPAPASSDASNSAAMQPAASAQTASAQTVSSPEHPLAYSTAWQTIQPGQWEWFAFKYDHIDTGKQSSSSSTSNQNTIHVVPAEILMHSQPADGVSLMLLNREQVQAWEQGNSLANFGAATDVVDISKKSTSLANFCRHNENDPACPNGSSTGSLANSRCINQPNAADPTARCVTDVFTPQGYANWSGVLGSSGTYYILVRRAANASGPAQFRFTLSGDGVTAK